MHGNQWVLKIAVLKYYSVSKRGTTAKSNPKQATDPISLHTKFGDNSSNTFPLNERKPCVTPDIMLVMTQWYTLSQNQFLHLYNLNLNYHVKVVTCYAKQKAWFPHSVKTAISNMMKAFLLCYSLQSCVPDSLNMVMASILRAQTPLMNAFFMFSSYRSLSVCKRATSARDSSKASFNCNTLNNLWKETSEITHNITF